MTGWEGSKPVYSYNRSKRVRENSQVRHNARLKQFSRFRSGTRKLITNVRRKKKRSSNSKYKQGIGRFIRNFL